MPLTGAARQHVRVHVEGVTLALALWWSPLAERWYLDAELATGEAIGKARQVAARARLLRPDPAVLLGDLAVWSTTEQMPDPPRDAWTSGDYELLYLDPDEVEQLPAWR